MTGKDYSPYSAGDTHEQKLELQKREHDHALRMEAERTRQKKYQLREARQDTWQVIGVGALVAAVILGIVYAVYLGTSGPESKEPSKDERRELACVQGGGGWVPEDLLSSSGDGLCVYPGKSPSGG